MAVPLSPGGDAVGGEAAVVEIGGASRFATVASEHEERGGVNGAVGKLEPHGLVHANAIAAGRAD
jgi:hypothetical protein